MAVYVVIVLLVCCLLASHSLNEVCIVSDDDSFKSLTFCNSTLTINSFCQQASENNISYTVATILSGTHTLNKSCKLNQVNNISFRGHSFSKSLIQCNGSGFIFWNVSFLRISSIEFNGCSANAQDFFNFALSFVYGSDLALFDVIVSDSNSGGIYINNVVGKVIVKNCKFLNATVNNPNGNRVQYTHSATTHTHLTIANSVISGFGYKGVSQHLSGLLLHLESPTVTVNVENTTFMRNSGNLGGNMGILFYAFASVTISNTVFRDGRAPNGGGMYVAFENSIQVSNDSNHCKLLRIINSTFSGNNAQYYGGGIYIIWWQKTLANKTVYMDIIGTDFFRNLAHSIGFAVYAISQSSNDASYRFNVKLSMNTCTFSHHHPKIPRLGLNNRLVAIFFASHVELSNINIKSNNCTAIFSEGSRLYFSGFTEITNNYATNGAGMQLVDSFFTLTSTTQLIITGNSAEKNGGGIAFSYPPDCIQHHCPILISSRDRSNLSTINLNVSNNFAVEGGNNIFGHIDHCYSKLFMKAILNVPHNSESEPSSISSNPQRICISMQDHGCHKYAKRTIYPGQRVSFPIHAVGIYNGTVSGTVSATDVGGIVINHSEKAQRVDVQGRNISYTVFSSQPHKSPHGKIILYPVEYCGGKDWQATTTVEIFFHNCPFGFNKVSVRVATYKCDCYSNPIISKCAIESLIISKKRYSWLGMFQLNNRSYIATNKYCPLDYCNSSFVDIKSSAHNLHQDEQCQYNRTGILCGSCPDGWSMGLGSSKCHEKCSSVWLLLIVPFALCGLLLIYAIHSLNLTVTMGTVCGLIFYANIIQDYSILLSTHPIPGLTTILELFLSWLNFDLGIPTCFYNGMDSFGKTMFLFAFPLYILTISANIVGFSHYYIRFTKLIGNNALKVLSTLFLLSYSKMLRITIGILNFKILNVYIGNSTELQMRWAVDGTIPYIDLHRHLVLFVIAIIFLALLLPFSLSLLCIRHVYSLSNICKVFACLNKLKPFFDTYTGPFEDRSRFWTGLLLFVRLILLIMHAFDYKDDVIPYYIIIAMCLALIAIIFLLRGVYKKWFLNVIEFFFISNICIFFLVNTFVSSPDLFKSILSHILVCSAFIVFLGIITYHVYLRVSHHCWIKKLCYCFEHVEPDLDDLVDLNMRGYGTIEQ